MNDVPDPPDGPTPSLSSSELELSPCEPLSDSSLTPLSSSSPDEDALYEPSPLTLEEASGVGISGSGDSSRGHPKYSLTIGADRWGHPLTVSSSAASGIEELPTDRYVEEFVAYDVA